MAGSQPPPRPGTVNTGERARSGYLYGRPGFEQWDAYWRTQDSAATQAEQRERDLIGMAGGGTLPGLGGGGMPTSTPGGWNAPSPTDQYGNYTGTVPDVSDIDASAANEAEFARARDVSGKIGRASLDSLRGLLGESGQLGGGAEVEGTRGLVETAAGEAGEVNRDQAIERLARGHQTALSNQQSRLTQRGQNMAAEESKARRLHEQTQSQAQRQFELLRMLLGRSQGRAQGSAQTGPSLRGQGLY